MMCALASVDPLIAEGGDSRRACQGRLSQRMHFCGMVGAHPLRAINSTMAQVFTSDRLYEGALPSGTVTGPW